MLQELISRADQRGYLTFDDVLEILDDEEGDEITTIENVLYELDELGIEIRQESETPNLAAADNSEIEFEPEELPHDPGIGDINAVSADDPVGLYFRQMAQEPLLTAQEEIDLAKRIELCCGRDSLHRG